MRLRLESAFELGDVTVPDRLYRAPLLEWPRNDPGAVEDLIGHLEPAVPSRNTLWSTTH